MRVRASSSAARDRPRGVSSSEGEIRDVRRTMRERRSSSTTRIPSARNCPSASRFPRCRNDLSCFASALLSPSFDMEHDLLFVHGRAKTQMDRGHMNIEHLVKHLQRRVRRYAGLSLVTVAVASAGACASAISPQQESQIGAQQSQEINAQLPIVNDASLNSYINSLDNQIASHGQRND